MIALESDVRQKQLQAENEQNKLSRELAEAELTKKDIYQKQQILDDDISTLQKRLELQKKEYEDNFSSNKQKEDQYHQSALDLAGQIKIIKD